MSSWFSDRLVYSHLEEGKESCPAKLAEDTLKESKGDLICRSCNFLRRLSPTDTVFTLRSVAKGSYSWIWHF